MKMLFAIIWISTIGLQTVSAQMDSTTLWYQAIFDSTADFYTIRDIQDHYFHTHPDSTAHESGIRNEFYRWARFWNHRVANDSGQVASITKAIRNFQEVYQDIEEIYEPPENPVSDWYYLGPKGLATQNYGIVICVKFDPNDPNMQTYYAGTGTSGLWKTTDGGLTWRNITGQYLAEGLGVMDILIHPSNPDIIYIAIGFGRMGRPYYYGSGILMTTDGGESWENILPLTPSDRKPITKLLMDPNNPARILAFGAKYIYKTQDGLNWSSVPLIPTSYCSACNNWVLPKVVKDAIFKPGSSDIVYVATDYCESNMAELWKIDDIFSLNPVFMKINDPPYNNFTDCERFALDIKHGTNQNPDEIFGGALHGNLFSVFKIDQDNSNFIQLCNVAKGSMNVFQCEFEMSDMVDNAFMVCGYYFRYFSGNCTLIQEFNNYSAGNSNMEIYHTDTRWLEYRVSDGKEFLLIGNDGGVTRAIRNPSSSQYTFSNVNGRGLYITEFFGLGVCNATPEKIAAGSQDNNLFTYKYDDSIWEVNFEGDAYEVVIHPVIPQYAYFFTGPGFGPSGLLRTVDGFNSYNTDIVSQTSNDNGGKVEKPIALQPGNPDVAYVGYQNVYKASSWNSNFELYMDRTTIPNLITSTEVVDIAIAPSSAEIMYVAYANSSWGTNSSLIKTINALDNTPDWVVLDPSGNVFIYSNKFGITHVAVASDDPDRLWITFGNFWSQDHVNQARVLESVNGGATFTDITSPWPHTQEGLPNLPVNCIKVIGDNINGYKIFIGNDIGIYLYDTQNNPNWTLFNYHLPPCVVSDIEFVPGTGEPDALRITTFGYGIWETLLDCSKNNDFEVITTSITWDSDQIKHNNVYIASGGSLTIKAKISFVEGTGLIVQEGGQLHIIDGILTSACGSLWNGVTVYGDPGQPISNPTYQGYAEFYDAVVENALAGVRTLGGDPDLEVGGVSQVEETYPAGGIIEATNTTFRNNYIGVLINPCSQQKLDLFNECSFEWSSELLSPYYSPAALVKLMDVNNVRFRGCSFSTAESFSQNQATGNGILSFNSTFYVDALCKAYNQNECTQWKRSEFSNLDYGVKTLAFSPTRTFRVDQADLEGNNTGIYASSTSAAQVTRNEFTILKLDTLSREHFGGLYLDFCNGYMVEDNVFTGPGGGDSPWAIGLIINNSNYGSYINADNEVYNNNFNTLNIGILAQNKNRSNSSGTNGLTVKCNDFYYCRYDIAVTVYDPNNLGLGIMDPQGQSGSNVTFPAGNIFTNVSIPPQSDYNYHNEGGGLTYYHHDQNYSSVKVEPTHYSSNVTPTVSHNGLGYDPLECCLSHFIPGGGGGVLTPYSLDTFFKKV